MLLDWPLQRLGETWSYGIVRMPDPRGNHAMFVVVAEEIKGSWAQIFEGSKGNRDDK